MAGDRYALEELFRIAQLKLLHVPTSVILAERGAEPPLDELLAEQKPRADSPS